MTYGVETRTGPTYTFRVRVRAGLYAWQANGDVWRDIVIAANQSMYALAMTILDAFDFDNDHMSSFYMSGKRGDRYTEIIVAGGSPEPSFSIFPFGLFRATPNNWPVPPPRYAAETLVRDAGLPAKPSKKEFLYLFDFGDNWEFGIQLLAVTDAVDERAIYPRIVAALGDPPPQYGGDQPFFDDADVDDLDDYGEGILLSFPRT